MLLEGGLERAWFCGCTLHGGEVLRVLSEQSALAGEGLARQRSRCIWLPGEVLVQVNQGFHLSTGSYPGRKCDKKLSEVGGCVLLGWEG